MVSTTTLHRHTLSHAIGTVVPPGADQHASALQFLIASDCEIGLAVDNRTGMKTSCHSGQTLEQSAIYMGTYLSMLLISIMFSDLSCIRHPYSWRLMLSTATATSDAIRTVRWQRPGADFRPMEQ